jgi:hypothetical protein
MRAKMSRHIFFGGKGYGWAEFVMADGDSMWYCQAGGKASEGFFQHNPEFKTEMTEAEMMMLYLKYGG